MTELQELVIVMRGAGDIASGVALRLHQAGLRNILFLETPKPMAVRRHVCFSEAVYLGSMMVEGVESVHAPSSQNILQQASNLWLQNKIPMVADPEGACLSALKPHILIDATISKKNVGISIHQAPLVIGLGPGIECGKDAHCVVETQRGLDLGRVLHQGFAAANTGVPGPVLGYTTQRVLCSPVEGLFETNLDIGAHVEQGSCVAYVASQPVISQISGILRGILRSNIMVKQGAKLGDVEPRPNVDTRRVSDKALAVGGGVLEAILAHWTAQKF